MSQKADEYFFSSDKPIDSSKEDILGRSFFSNKLAEAITCISGNENHVIALYGEWGSGKTSIKNMIKEKLKSKNNVPEIMDFNPWQWSGQSKICESFYNEIGISLGRIDSSKKAQNAFLKYQKLSLFSDLGFSVIEIIQKIITFVVLPFWVLTGIERGFLKTSWGGYAIIILSILSFLLLSIKTLAHKYASINNFFCNHNQKSLQEIKNELIGILKKSDKSILVIIDDIDRLTAEEIRLLFRLIKANADFPKVTYLLLFQRDIIEYALKTESINGSEYLKKIVQLGFEIPSCKEREIHELLFSGLDKLLDNNDFDKVRWANVFSSGLKYYFLTLRDVKRFLSTLSFHTSILCNSEIREVNDIDLISIETLRVFEPVLYNLLPTNKAILTRIADYGMSSPEYKKREKEKIESIVSRAMNVSAATEIIKHLFPTIEWVFENRSYASSYSSIWLKELRICSPEIFDRYFRYSLSKEDISLAEINYFLSASADNREIERLFEEYHNKGILNDFIDRLEVYKDDVPTENIVPFLVGLFNGGEFVSNDRRSGIFNVDIFYSFYRITNWLLNKLDDKNKIEATVSEVISKSDGVYIPLRFISLLSEIDKDSIESVDILISDHHLKVMQKTVADKIKKVAESGFLLNQNYLLMALFKWKDWLSIDEVRIWVDEVTNTRGGLLQFLISAQYEVVSQGLGDHAPIIEKRLSLKNIENFIPIKRLTEKVIAAETNGPPLIGENKSAIELYKFELKKREEGISEDAW